MCREKSHLRKFLNELNWYSGGKPFYTRTEGGKTELEHYSTGKEIESRRYRRARSLDGIMGHLHGKWSGICI